MNKQKKKVQINETKRIGWFVAFKIIVTIVLTITCVVNTVEVIHMKATINNQLNQKVIVIPKVVFGDEVDEKIIFDYVNRIDEKADAAIDKVIAVVGVLITIVTIYGGLIAFKAPKDMEERLNQIDEEINLSKKASERSRYLLELQEAIKDGTTSEKIAELDRIIDEYPTYFDAYHYQGSYYDDLKEYDKAISLYEKARCYGWDQTLYFNCVAVAYDKKGEKESAKYFYSKAIESINDMTKTNTLSALYSNRGSCYDECGDYNSALEDYKIAILYNPKNGDALQNRSHTYISIARNEKELLKRVKYLELAKDDIYNSIKLDKEKQNRQRTYVSVLMQLKEVYEELCKEEKDIDKWKEYISYANINAELARKWVAKLPFSRENMQLEAKVVSDIIKSQDESEDKRSIIAIDEQGEKGELDVLFTFENAVTNKEYIVYTDNIKNENGLINVYANILQDELDDEEYSLQPIETEHEWKMVEQILNTLQEGIKEGIERGMAIEEIINNILKEVEEPMQVNPDSDRARERQLMNMAVDAYCRREINIAEKTFLLLYEMNPDNVAVCNNLAYMKRRGETVETDISIPTLLKDRTDAFCLVNRVLCHIQGVEYEKNWDLAKKIICDSEEDFDEVKSWWSQINIVGEEESNLVLLLLLLHEQAKGHEIDLAEMNGRIEKARNDGYNIM